MHAVRRLWSAVVGPSGWRSVIGPIAFALVAIALLIYDHVNQRVPALVFWLTLGLIVTIFVRMLETNRRQSRALAVQRRDAVNDRVTGLRNRSSLEADISAAAAAPGGTTGSLQGGDLESPLSCSYGEVRVPAEAADAEAVLQTAGRRLAAHRQRRHRSARRQAHAVLMAALDARQPELRGHLRVAAYRAISLARRMELDREEIDDIALAAELQKVGLLAVPECVLAKEALDEGERAIVRTTPPRASGSSPLHPGWRPSRASFAPAQSTSTAAAIRTAWWEKPFRSGLE